MKYFLALLALLLPAVPAQAQFLTTLTSFEEQSIGNAQRYGLFDFQITNGTNTTWTDFHVRDAEPIGIITGVTGPGTVVNSGGLVDFFGLSVAPGGVLSFSITTFCLGEICSLGGSIWRGTPTIDGTGGGVTTPIPEPETYAMLLAGLALLGFVYRRGNRTTAAA